MHLLSVNLGVLREVPGPRSTHKTGIDKRPAEGPVHVGFLGLAGDAIVNARHHGGPDQAVYLYGELDYAWWSAALGRELEPGTFGENLTIGGLEDARLSIGDRLRIGEVILEVTAPRVPCSNLAWRMGDPGFVKKFRDAERPGAYCRVLAEGSVQAGDPVVLEPYVGPEPFGLIEVFRDVYEPALDPASVRRYLAAPIAIRLRQHKEQQAS